MFACLYRPPAPDGVPVHPAPLYEAVGCLALFLGLSWLIPRRRFDGQAILAFGIGYGVWRSFVECFRADDVRGMFLGGWLSTSQIIGLVSAMICGVVLWRNR